MCYLTDGWIQVESHKGFLVLSTVSLPSFLLRINPESVQTGKTGSTEDGEDVPHPTFVTEVGVETGRTDRQDLLQTDRESQRFPSSVYSVSLRSGLYYNGETRNQRSRYFT